MASQIKQTAWTHPEIKEGEVLLRNMTGEEFGRLTFTSKRQGRIAYDGEGNQLSFKDWLPVFLQQNELDERGINLTSLRKELQRIA